MRSTLPSIWQRRHLIGVLVRSNVKRQNRNSTLGYLWWFLDPILTAAVYYIVVVILFHRGENNQPFILFLVCGLFPWKAFADSTTQSVGAIRGQSAIIRSISFPKAVLPIAHVFSNAIYFCFGLIVATSFALFYAPEYGCWPSWAYLMIPVVLLVQIILSIGVAFAVATLGLFFTDMRNIVSHSMRFLYFCSPGIYGIDLIPEHIQPYYRINPFAGLFTSYRAIILKGELPKLIDLLPPLAVGIVALIFGYTLFLRMEGRMVQKL